MLHIIRHEQRRNRGQRQNDQQSIQLIPSVAPIPFYAQLAVLDEHLHQENERAGSIQNIQYQISHSRHLQINQYRVEQNDGQDNLIIQKNTAYFLPHKPLKYQIWLQRYIFFCTYTNFFVSLHKFLCI